MGLFGQERPRQWEQVQRPQDERAWHGQDTQRGACWLIRPGGHGWARMLGLKGHLRVLASILMRWEMGNHPSEIIFEQRSDMATCNFRRITLSTLLGQAGDGDSGLW